MKTVLTGFIKELVAKYEADQIEYVGPEMKEFARNARTSDRDAIALIEGFTRMVIDKIGQVGG